MQTIKMTLAALALAVSTGCSSITTTTNYDSDASFSSYRTFQVESRSSLPEPLTKEIERAITGELQRRGLIPAEDGDIVINYFTLVNDKTIVRETPEVTLLNHRRGYTVWNTYETEIRNVTEGTLIVDVVDANTDRLIWEGYVEGALSRGDFSRNVRKIAEGVLRLFENMPLGGVSDE